MASVTTMPVDGDWTVDDLAQLPDDGLRYELVDGVLLVSPSPLVPHQLGLAGLLAQLTAAAPADLRVLPAPLDITFSRTRLLQPDIVVLDVSQLSGPKVEGVPLLAVEVLSPSTRATDLTLKRYVLEQAGVPSYWLFDVEAVTLTVLDLVDGAYVETATVSGDSAYDVERPFPIRLSPAAYLR